MIGWNLQTHGMLPGTWLLERSRMMDVLHDQTRGGLKVSLYGKGVGAVKGQLQSGDMISQAVVAVAASNSSTVLTKATLFDKRVPASDCINRDKM